VTVNVDPVEAMMNARFRTELFHELLEGGKAKLDAASAVIRPSLLIRRTGAALPGGVERAVLGADSGVGGLMMILEFIAPPSLPAEKEKVRAPPDESDIACRRARS